MGRVKIKSQQEVPIKEDLWSVHANGAASCSNEEGESPKEAGIHRRGEEGCRNCHPNLAKWKIEED